MIWARAMNEGMLLKVYSIGLLYRENILTEFQINFQYKVFA